MTKEPSILVVLNKTYKENMSTQELYEITRKHWPFAQNGERHKKAKYVFGIFHCVIKSAYRIIDWERTTIQDKKRKNRWAFTGIPAQEMGHLIGKEIPENLRSRGRSFIYWEC